MRPAPHTVLVTGGATGIGFAIAEKFHAAGNRVILVGRSEAALSRATADLPGAESSVADITQPEDRARLIERFPEVSVLVNNAGVQLNGPLASTAPEDLEYELGVNFLAPALLSRGFLPLLLNRPAAAIVNISSGLALVPKESAAMYCAAKAAFHSFSKSLRWQLEGTGVEVFEVLPPLVETAMTAGRGKGKISPSRLADEFWEGFKAGEHEMLVGKTRLLSLINRLAPSIAEGVMRRSK